MKPLRRPKTLFAVTQGGKVWDRDVRRYLHSTRIPVYNPVDEYLRRVRGH